VTDINQLATDLVNWNIAYRGGKPLVADPVFDAAEQALKAAAPHHPVLKTLRSDLIHGRTYPLTMWSGSQEKAMNEEEVASFWAAYYGKAAAHVSYKGDGASCQIVYRDGILHQILTKGNGVDGTDITAPTRHAVPLFVPADLTAVRGEVLLTKSALAAVNAELEADGLDPFVNTRNSVVAILRAYDKYAKYAHHLTVMVYDSNYQDAATREGMMFYLAQQGFQSFPAHVVDTLNNLFRFKADTTLLRAGLDYDIDGLVVCPNDLGYAKQLGYSSDRAYRKGEFAVKFDAEGAISTIVDIEWSAEGRNYISPIAIIDPPVQLAGASINRVSLKSVQWAETYNVGIGTVIRIERSGDVIPVIPVDRKSGAPLPGSIVDNSVHVLNTPASCPCCQQPTVRDGARLACTSIACPAKEAADFVHFGASLELKGIGHATALTWLAAGVSFADFVAGAADGWAEVDRRLATDKDVSYGLWSNIRAQLV
jgi:DNA ligase (NAD+)